MNHLKQIFDQSNTASEYAKAYLSHLTQLLERIDTKKIDEIINLIYKARRDNKTIYLIGNGGSAVCASHWCNDLTNGTKVKGKKTIKAISLTDNTASITALANDSGYENIFLLQLENLLNPGDIVIGISASGNSPNVVKAFEFANSVGATTVALIGFEGGAMKLISKVVLHIATGKGEYGPVEDIQLVLDHLISSYLRYAIEIE